MSALNKRKGLLRARTPVQTDSGFEFTHYTPSANGYDKRVSAGHGSGPGNRPFRSGSMVISGPRLGSIGATHGAPGDIDDDDAELDVS